MWKRKSCNIIHKLCVGKLGKKIKDGIQNNFPKTKFQTINLNKHQIPGKINTDQSYFSNNWISIVGNCIW